MLINSLNNYKRKLSLNPYNLRRFCESTIFDKIINKTIPAKIVYEDNAVNIYDYKIIN